MLGDGDSGGRHGLPFTRKERGGKVLHFRRVKDSRSRVRTRPAWPFSSDSVRRPECAWRQCVKQRVSGGLQRGDRDPASRSLAEPTCEQCGGPPPVLGPTSHGFSGASRELLGVAIPYQNSIKLRQTPAGRAVEGERPFSDSPYSGPISVDFRCELIERSTVTRATLFPAPGHPLRTAGELKGRPQWVDAKRYRRKNGQSVPSGGVPPLPGPLLAGRRSMPEPGPGGPVVRSAPAQVGGVGDWDQSQAAPGNLRSSVRPRGAR